MVETQADGAVILRGGIAEDCGPKRWINFGPFPFCMVNGLLAENGVVCLPFRTFVFPSCTDDGCHVG